MALSARASRRHSGQMCVAEKTGGFKGARREDEGKGVRMRAWGHVSTGTDTGTAAAAALPPCKEHGAV